MTITKFRELNRDRAITLKLSEIRLTEPCHRKAERKGCKVSELNADPTCIVHKNESDSYNLVIGYRDYITAKQRGNEEIKAIVVSDKSRRAFLKSLEITPEIWNISEVHAPIHWTYPSPWKINSCKECYKKTGTFGKQIVVSPSGTILDGYAAVCAARLIGLKKIPVNVVSVQAEKYTRKKFSKPS